MRELLFNFYRLVLSPFLHLLTHTVLPGAGCRFYPSCSVYAREAFRTFPLHRALFLIASRLSRCTPFSRGGVDELPKLGTRA